LILAALPFLAELSFAQQPQYDFIISGGHIVDGTGAPWFAADIGITADRIAAIGDLSKASAAERLNATNRVVSPGFIDVQGRSEFNVLVDNRARMSETIP
jgi:N-acyl-D-aspartate/D-glutamate deacylase